MSNMIAISPHDPAWPTLFTAEAERIRAELGSTIVAIEHVGSTSVQGLGARPVIDIVVGLKAWRDASAAREALVHLGYTEGQIPRSGEEHLFFRKAMDGGLEFFLHVAPHEGSFSRSVVTFRNALREDRECAGEYERIKRTAALKHGGDEDAYLLAKAPFIQSVLAREASRSVAENFLRHQRAELDRAERLHVASLCLQFVVAVIAGIAVFTDDGETLLVLAILGGLFALLWMVVAQYGRRHRSAGDQARRVVLLASGLGHHSADAGMLMEAFGAPIAKTPRVEITKYFDSSSLPGPQRVGEMLDESAFYTGHLHRKSGEILTLFMLIVICASVLVWLAQASSMDDDAIVATARVFMAFLVFVLSSDIVGAAFGHFSAGQAMTRIRLRIGAAAARGYPHADILLLLADYNAEVEAAPMILPRLYNHQQKQLNERWRDYLAAKAPRHEGDEHE